MVETAILNKRRLCRSCAEKRSVLRTSALVHTLAGAARSFLAAGGSGLSARMPALLPTNQPIDQ